MVALLDKKSSMIKFGCQERLWIVVVFLKFAVIDA
jgi:hypothetical protein